MTIIIIIIMVKVGNLPMFLVQNYSNWTDSYKNNSLHHHHPLYDLQNKRVKRLVINLDEPVDTSESQYNLC